MIAQVAAVACCIWYCAVVLVCTIGYTQIQRHYSRQPRPARCLASRSNETVPHVTIIRPVKGLEPFLYECLAATFHQTYPKRKLTICFCVSSRTDPALPVLEQLTRDFPDFDSIVFVEEEDPYLRRLEQDGADFGPNPKIRNMSRAYREAKGDIVWIIDCNVWVGRGVAGRMVDTLCGYEGGRKNKFVHQLPLVVDTSDVTAGNPPRLSWKRGARHWLFNLLATGGGRLEELFMSSAHAKFYTAINTVLIAPCIVGKSNMFRRSHLNALTNGRGIDYFSQNICEDHLIGDLLWKREVPGSILKAAESEGDPTSGKSSRKWGNHALLPYDPALQPMEYFPVFEYIARRVRWLRVRKFTVTLATLVEPGTESFLCGIYGAYAITTLPFFRDHFHIPQTWTVFWIFWISSTAMWAAFDWTLYQRLHAAQSVEVDEHTPIFARKSGYEAEEWPKRPFAQWLLAWLGRESLAFPVWSWAVWGGTSVSWRGKKFWVGMDMRVHEIQAKSQHQGRGNTRHSMNGNAATSKLRKE